MRRKQTFSWSTKMQIKNYFPIKFISRLFWERQVVSVFLFSRVGCFFSISFCCFDHNIKFYVLVFICFSFSFAISVGTGYETITVNRARDHFPSNSIVVSRKKIVANRSKSRVRECVCELEVDAKHQHMCRWFSSIDGLVALRRSCNLCRDLLDSKSEQKASINLKLIPKCIVILTRNSSTQHLFTAMCSPHRRCHRRFKSNDTLRFSDSMRSL